MTSGQLTPSTSVPRPPRGASPEDQISVFALASAFLRHRWLIIRWAIALGAIASVPLLFLKRNWTASASFVSKDADPSQSGLRSLAGQFGVALPGTGSSFPTTPEFYADLVTSRVVLAPIVEGTVVLPEDGGRTARILDLLKVNVADSARRGELGIIALRKVIDPGFSRTTGVVNVSVRTKWPSLSYAIADRVVKGVNAFNLQARQAQAAEERRFVEARLDAQRQTLRNAEDRLGAFLQQNRQFSNSPQLTFDHERLQREVSLQQQVLVGLAQSYEETRIREVRDVPVVTLVETPVLPVRPDSRGLIIAGVAGVFAGVLVGMLIGLMRDSVARRRAAGDEDIARFSSLAAETRGDVWRLLGRRRS